LLALPLLVLVYIWLLRRKKKLALRYASLSIVKEALGKSAHALAPPHAAGAVPAVRWRAMLLAAARPMAVITLPSTNQETIILAMDVSGSMRATDVQTQPLVASQEAAKAFLADLPRSVRVGIVAFAGHGPGGAAAHAEPRRPGRSHRQVPVATRHRHWQRHRRVADRDFSRRRYRPVRR
jgi:Ca-activated chloride channel family protein